MTAALPKEAQWRSDNAGCAAICREFQKCAATQNDCIIQTEQVRWLDLNFVHCSTAVQLPTSINALSTGISVARDLRRRPRLKPIERVENLSVISGDFRPCEPLANVRLNLGNMAE
jgi:hypothetical protein